MEIDDHQYKCRSVGGQRNLLAAQVRGTTISLATVRVVREIVSVQSPVLRRSPLGLMLCCHCLEILSHF